MAKIISIANQKGGVGKTTTATNLATSLAAVGKKTLLLDADAQGNAGTGFGINKNKIKISLYDVLLDKNKVHEAILQTDIKKLDILPSDMSLAGIEIELSSQNNFRFVLKSILGRIIEKYEYIIIDCPPSLGVITVNAFVASDSIIIPLQCEFFALEGLKHLLGVFQAVQSRLNSILQIEGVLLTMYDRRNKLTELVEQDVRKCLGSLVYNTVIPRNVKLSEAPSHGKPALVYDSSCAGSLAYMSMAKELINKKLIMEKV